MGELTAMVAHEIKQPLGAILSNTDAAEMLLRSADPPLQEIREILADIRASDLRANDAIRRSARWCSKQEICLQPIDLNATVSDVLRLTAARPAASASGVAQRARSVAASGVCATGSICSRSF